MAVQENSHTATNKGYLTSFKKTTNPNVSPIGKRFGFECSVMGVQKRTMLKFLILNAVYYIVVCNPSQDGM